MTSIYLALPEKQLRIFLSYLPQESLKKYLYNGDIYKGRRNMLKNDLIDMIITERSKKVTYSQEDDELTKEEAKGLRKNNNFAKPNNISNSTPEIKPKLKLLNN